MLCVFLFLKSDMCTLPLQTSFHNFIREHSDCLKHYICFLICTHNLRSSTDVANSKRFSISFGNTRGLFSNLNSVHQHLQSSNPHSLFVTEITPRTHDSNVNSILSPLLKFLGYELFSSSFPNGGVFVHLSILMYKPHN